MARWWEYDNGGPKVPELPVEGEFRIPASLFTGVSAFLCFVGAVVALFLGSGRLATVGVFVGVVLVFAAQLLLPSDKPNR